MFVSDEMEISGDHFEFRKRIRRSLYYSHLPVETCSSLPLTEWAVEFLQDASPRKLGKVDTYFASAVARESCISPCSMMLGMLYIERLKHKNPDYLQTVSSSELFLISMMMATKYLQDEGVEEEVFNDEWAESCNMEISDLNKLEKDFLSAMDWRLFVNRNDFNQQLDSVERSIALCEGFKRGWFTYSDLYVLMNDPKFSRLLQDLGQDIKEVIIGGSVAYLAGFMTLLGSTLLVSYISTSLPITILLTSRHLSVNPIPNQLPAIEGPVSEVNETAEVPVVTETTEVDLDSTEYEREAVVKKKNQLSGIIRRFWALFMLKDTLVNLMSAQQIGECCRGNTNVSSGGTSRKSFQENRTFVQSTKSTKPHKQSTKLAESQPQNYPSISIQTRCCNCSKDCSRISSPLRMPFGIHHRFSDCKGCNHLFRDSQKGCSTPCIGYDSWFDTGHRSCSLEDSVHRFRPGISQQITVMT